MFLFNCYKIGTVTNQRIYTVYELIVMKTTIFIFRPIQGMPKIIFLIFLLCMQSYVLYHKDCKICNITSVHTLTKHIIFSGNICLTITMWWNKKTWVLRAKRVWCLHFYWRPCMPPSKYCNVTFPETLLHKKKVVAYPV